MENEFYEGKVYNASNISEIDVEIGTLENSVKNAILKKWLSLKLGGQPTKILEKFDKIKFPERKNILCLILGSFIVKDEKINQLEFKKILTQYKKNIDDEKVRREDILRYGRFFLTL